MQTVTISGNLGKDAELKTTQGGDSVLGFSVAVKQGWGDKASTNWFRCSVWGKRAANLADYLRKGTKVVVQGELTIGSYEGKPQFDVRVGEVEFMSAREGGQSTQRDTGGGMPSGGNAADDDFDSIPF